MGSAFPTRLSFMRILLRRLCAEKSKVTRPVWEIDTQGFGRAVYSVQLGGNIYSLVAFSCALAAEDRTDRVIAEAWDASFALFDGVPTEQDMERLEKNAPLQEAGRFLPSELVISRANKSVRLFEHVVDRLSKGLQPEEEMIGSVGYLMRTTAVYGNGKFGFADRVCIKERTELNAPFQAEMLTVWLIRGFTHDLVEHVAKLRDLNKYAPLKTAVKKNLGIGNSTGLGMAPFLIKHPVLLNNWVRQREVALARVRGVKHAEEATIQKFKQLIKTACQHVKQWNVEDARQMKRIKILRNELAELDTLTTHEWLEKANPWDRIINVTTKHSTECQELIAALVIEPHGELVDDLSNQLSDNMGLHLDPSMEARELQELLVQNYQWALDIDFDCPKQTQYFWYTSQEKSEPRLGKRLEEPGADLELPLDVAKQANLLARDLTLVSPAQSVALFLLNFPQHRHIVRRVQTSKLHPYLEIRDNLIGSQCMPLDILRFKLSFFGASKCDPKSNLWTRINMYQGAPLFEDVCNQTSNDWWLPVLRQEK